jgi:hypothetical protein
MMVSVADKSKVDTLGLQRCRVGSAKQRIDVPKILLSCRLGDVLQEIACDVNGDDSPLITHLLGKQPGEQPRTCTNVGNGSSRLDCTSLQDRLATLKNLATLNLKLLDILLDLGILERIINPRLNALVLRKYRSAEDHRCLTDPQTYQDRSTNWKHFRPQKKVLKE